MSGSLRVASPTKFAGTRFRLASIVKLVIGPAAQRDRVLEDPEIITLPLLECHLERFAIKVFQANKVRSGRGDPSSSRFNSKISDLWLDLLKGHAKQLHGLLVVCVMWPQALHDACVCAADQ